MKYKTETEILKLVETFETGTIARENWGHAEHLVVGLYYLRECGAFDRAYEKMRAGIFNLLRAFKVDLTKEMPYHETLTVFWLKTIDEFNKAHFEASLVEASAALIEKFDKDYPLRFYSRELLFSDEARKTYLAPDISNSKIVDQAS